MLAVGSAIAQPAPAQAQSVTFMTTAPGDAITITHWYKQKVSNQNNALIAEIDDVLTNPQGQIVAFVLGVGGFLGIGEKHVAVPFNAVQFNTRDGNRWYLLMNSTADALKAAPGLTYDREKAVWVPATAPASPDKK